MKFPFSENFTLKESDTIEALRKYLTDSQIVIEWAHLNRTCRLKKTSTQVKEYLTRNRRKDESV